MRPAAIPHKMAGRSESASPAEWSLMTRLGRISVPVCLLVLAACNVLPHPSPGTPAGAASIGGSSAESSEVVRMLEDIRALSSIGAHRGWRTTGGPGETEAFEYIEQQLALLADTNRLDVDLTRQTFRLPVGSQIHEARLWLDASQGEAEARADAICCSRRADETALFYDSDGTANDSHPDPVEVSGRPQLVRSAGEIDALQESVGDGVVVLVDFALVDTYVQGTETASLNATRLLDVKPRAIVLITEFSNEVGRSHGTQAAGGSIFSRVAKAPWPPILYARLEDLAAAGASTWEALRELEAVRLRWDVDVFMPGQSANLILRLAGKAPAHSVILGAHVDSVNVPGALDDGSGVAVLLEVVRQLAASGDQPPYDLYLVWFGAEEVGLVGSSYFAATHQELLDETLAVLTVDCLGSPLEGFEPRLTFGSWPYGVAGQMHMPWSEALANHVSSAGDETAISMSGGGSDNTSFVAYDVPNANLIAMDEEAMNAAGGIHYAIHIHDPYDAPPLAEKESAALERMFDVTYAAAMGTVADMHALRVSPKPRARALLVGSHTEAMDMPMTALTSFGIVMAMQGVDLDLVPYGEPVDAACLADADMAILLPVMDYPAEGLGEPSYDETWSAAEIEAIVDYAERGGVVVLAGSLHQLGWSNELWDPNEDWDDINLVAQRFGLTFVEGPLSAPITTVAEGSMALGVSSLECAEGNGLPIASARGEVLARSGEASAVVYLPFGEVGGGVLALGDLGMLGSYTYDPRNVPFWEVLAGLALRD